MWNFFKRNKPKQQTEIQDDYSDEDNDDIVREPNKVAERILGLFAVIGKVHKNDESDFWDWYKKNQIEKYLSTNEREFIIAKTPKENDIINFSWRAEALTSLLWSAKILDEMPSLKEQFEIFSINGIADLINKPKEFISQIELRSDSELREMEYDLFDSHWKVRDAQLHNKEMPKELNGSVVYERRYGMSWIIGHGENWDDVPTDT